MFSYLLKILLIVAWILLFTITGIEHYVYHMQLSVWDATVQLTLLVMAFSFDNDEVKING